MKSPRSSDVAALIPQHWRLTASTAEEIIFLGQATIREMIRSWRYTDKDLASQIKSVNDKMDLLRGRGATDIREIAEKHESPEFPRVGKNINGCPKPLDAASLNRKNGETTFNFCGWCQYAMGISRLYGFYDCFITASCSINCAAGLKDEKRHFNTPCFLKEATDEVFNEIRKGLTRERKRLIRKRQNIDKKIKILFNFEERAEKKPLMSRFRPCNWFKANDLVVCYIGDWENRIVPDIFATATVINPHDRYCGHVSVCFDKRVHADSSLEGRGGIYQISRPEILHGWEFEYLLNHPDFTRLWLEKGRSEYLDRFDTGRFLDAFTHEAARRASKNRSK